MGVGMSIPFPFLFPFAQAALAQAAGLPKFDLLALHTGISDMLPATDCDADVCRPSATVGRPADIMQDNNVSIDRLREALTDGSYGGREGVGSRFITTVDISKSMDTPDFTASDSSK